MESYRQRQAAPPSRLVSCLAVLVVAAVLGMGISVVFSGAASGTNVRMTAAPRASSLPLGSPVPGAPPLDVYGMAMAAADSIAPELPLALRDAAARRVAAMSPTEILAQAEVHAEDLTGAAGAFLTGCFIGGLAGAAMGGVGAGIGCVAAGIATLIWYQIGLAQGAAANQAQVVAWLKSMNVELGNELNLTASAVGNELQALALAQNAFSYAASNAALLQLGSSTFNVYQAMNDSGVPAQLETFYAAEGLTLGRSISGMLNWSYQSFSGSGPFAGSGSSYMAYFPMSVAPTLATRVTIYPGYFWRLASTSESPYVYIAKGSTVAVSEGNIFGQSCPGTGAETATASPVWSPSTSYTIHITPATWNNPSGVYALTSASCTVFGTGMMPVATSSYSSLPPPRVGNVGGGGLGGNPGVIEPPGNLNACFGDTTSCAHLGTYSNPLYPSGWNQMAQTLSNLMANAGTVALAYWQFIRNLGYTSASQVPENCFIPMPYQALPPNMNLGNLTSDQVTSLYYAWLQGLGNFFNVTLSSTNYCGQRPGKFSLGDNVTWNLNNVAVGNLYLPSKAAQETYSNPSTWAVAGRQLILMPTLHSIRVPVGTVYPVPALNPIGVYVLNVSLSTGVQIGFPTWYQLIGNGTQTLSTMSLGDSPSAQATTGAAIYLTSCTVNGVPQTICSVSIETLNNTAANLTTPYVPPGGGGMWGIPNPFQVLGDAICKLLGPLCPSGGAAWATAALEVIFAVAVVVVLVVVVSAFARRRGKGSSGAGGVTVNLKR